MVGAILVIVGFSLWPVLNGASNSLYSYFRDSCDDGNGNRFLRLYLGDSQDPVPSSPNANAYYYNAGVAGGKGLALIRSTGTDTTLCQTANPGSLTRVVVVTPTNLGVNMYNEQGVIVGTVASAGTIGGSKRLDDTYQFIEVATMLKRFQGINNLLLTIIPVVSIAGFLGISGAKLYSYGKGTASIGSSISTSLFTLIGIVVAMVIAGPIMGSAVDANQVVESGQYQVNGTFGNIIGLLFAMIPVVYVAGLVTLVGLQARSALMGNK